MTLTLEAQPLPLRTDERSTVRIGKTRITLDLLIEAFESGDRPEEIVAQIPTLERVKKVRFYSLLRHEIPSERRLF